MTVDLLRPQGYAIPTSYRLYGDLDLANYYRRTAQGFLQSAERAGLPSWRRVLDDGTEIHIQRLQGHNIVSIWASTERVSPQAWDPYYYIIDQDNTPGYPNYDRADGITLDAMHDAPKEYTVAETYKPIGWPIHEKVISTDTVHTAVQVGPIIDEIIASPGAYFGKEIYVTTTVKEYWLGDEDHPYWTARVTDSTTTIWFWVDVIGSDAGRVPDAPNPYVQTTTVVIDAHFSSSEEVPGSVVLAILPSWLSTRPSVPGDPESPPDSFGFYYYVYTSVVTTHPGAPFFMDNPLIAEFNGSETYVQTVEWHRYLKHAVHLIDGVLSSAIRDWSQGSSWAGTYAEGITANAYSKDHLIGKNGKKELNDPVTSSYRFGPMAAGQDPFAPSNSWDVIPSIRYTYLDTAHSVSKDYDCCAAWGAHLVDSALPGNLPPAYAFGTLAILYFTK